MLFRSVNHVTEVDERFESLHWPRTLFTLHDFLDPHASLSPSYACTFIIAAKFIPAVPLSLHHIA